MVNHEAVAEVETVVMSALVGWEVVNPELKVLLGEGSVTEVMRLDLDVELGTGSVLLKLLQVLQHIRW